MIKWMAKWQHVLKSWTASNNVFHSKHMNSNWEMKLSHRLSQLLSDSSCVIYHFLTHFLWHFLFFILRLPRLSLSLSAMAVPSSFFSSFTRREIVAASSFSVLCHLPLCFYFNHVVSCLLAFSPHFFLMPCPSPSFSHHNHCSLPGAYQACAINMPWGCAVWVYVCVLLLDWKKAHSVDQHRKDIASVCTSP